MRLGCIMPGRPVAACSIKRFTQCVLCHANSCGHVQAWAAPQHTCCNAHACCKARPAQQGAAGASYRDPHATALHRNREVGRSGQKAEGAARAQRGQGQHSRACSTFAQSTASHGPSADRRSREASAQHGAQHSSTAARQRAARAANSLAASPCPSCSASGCPAAPAKCALEDGVQKLSWIYAALHTALQRRSKTTGYTLLQCPTQSAHLPPSSLNRSASQTHE